MYSFALKISEIGNHNKNLFHAIRYEDCKLDSNYNLLTLRLLTYKHSANPAKFRYRCPPSLTGHFQQYQTLRGHQPGLLFQHQNGDSFSRKFVLNNLRYILSSIGITPNQYNTHGFRAGRASDMATAGYTGDQISLLGRWHSDAYKTYIKPPVIQV